MRYLKRNLYALGLVIMLICILSFQVSPIFSAEIEGVVFEDALEIQDMTMDLKGTGVIRYLYLFKVSVAAFYLPKGVSSDRALQDIQRRLVIEYFHPIKAEDFVLSTNTWVQRNVSPEAFLQLQPQLERYNALYEDVRPGDRYSLTYIPGKGTELALNGKPKGTIPGAAFSAALFSIWIGPKPLSDDLRTSLLGQP